MRKSSLITALAFVLLFSSLASAEEEKITITTYYPSPYGVYKNLRIYPSDSRPTQAEGRSAGLMIFNNSTEKLEYYNGTKWQTLGSSFGECRWKRKIFVDCPNSDPDQCIGAHDRYSAIVRCDSDEYAVTGGANCGADIGTAWVLDDNGPWCSSWAGNTCGVDQARGWFADCTEATAVEGGTNTDSYVYVLCCKK